ncbi:putative bifunctional diguanylate cyclase/phosphodiesterase [Pseudidiomarina sp.]|uniref:putative bifunctional diguanylate cyclase/phosphodiesterase n=1 Tax=Pseudidiomarina sp. TaxID=2081707 RepID=UPI00299DB065|nr:EAL domain-containing protein [Pseudidiomarina sp.]MDX1705649.1 EAL domain-containing protein [Pseudidiomarina sp.]
MALNSKGAIQVDAEAAFHRLAGNLIHSGSPQFFAKLAELLAQILSVDHVLIAETCPDDSGYARSLANYSMGRHVADVRYLLHGTPCEMVVRGDFCSYPEGVRKRFPDDHLLQETAAESYLGVSLRDRDGNQLGLLAIMHNTPSDFSATAAEVVRIAAAQAAAHLAQAHTEQSLRESERRLSTLMSNLPGVAYRCKNDGRWTMEFMSCGAEKLTGYRVEQLLNNKDRSYFDIIVPEDRQELRQQLVDSQRKTGAFEITYRIVHANGEQRWVSEQGQVISGEESQSSYIEGFIEDITERHLQHEKISKLAYQDTVTDLPNRFAFLEKLNEFYHDAAANNQRVALLVLDLQRFKEINDLQGFHIGDILLRKVAERLQAITGPDEYLARFAGDEFALVVSDYQPGKQAAIVKRLRQALTPPFSINDSEFRLRATVGVACSDNSSSAESLLQAASIAMHQAKLMNSDLCLYDEALASQLVKRQYQTERFIEAIHNDGLAIYFQPQIDLHTGALVGAEVLCRWRDDELGSVPPDVFIGIAREQGLLEKLGDMVMQLSCQQIRDWQQQFGDVVGMSLNLAVQQFNNPQLAERFVELRGDIPSNLLTLEITESDLMVDAEEAARITKELADEGFRLAIDDFGTGYSSLAYLQRFAIDFLKIDMSFVQNMHEDKNSEAIVSTIIAMAKSLGMRTIAEGVETAEQVRILKAAGCDFAQGFYFDRPMTGERFAEKWLKPETKHVVQA